MIGIIIKQYFGKRKFIGLTLGVQNSLFFDPKVAQNSVVHI